MEFYKIRYNILKLFRDTNIYYKNLSISIINLKNTIYFTIIIFLLIFLIGFKELNYYTIFFIIILISFYFISIEIDNKINKIKTQKFFNNYKYNYELFNKFFIYSLNQIPNLDENADKYANLNNEYEYIKTIFILYKYIKNTCCFNENLLKEDFEEYLSNLKINNDVIRYINIYNELFIDVKNWLIIKINKDDKNLTDIHDKYDLNKENNIDDLNSETKVNEIVQLINVKPFNTDNYYIINLKLLNENYKNLRNDYIINVYDYIKKIFELKDGDLEYLKENDFNLDESVKKSIEDFNYSFNKLIIFLILFMTIILHIMFYKFYY